MAKEYTKPLPRTPGYEEPFWQAAKKRELRLQRCDDCAGLRYPVSPVCPHCLSVRYQWAKLSGKGKVSSWIIYHHAFHPGFADDIPYNVAWVDLEEGPRLTSNIVGARNDELYAGMPVEAVFEDVTEAVTLVKFRPASARA